MCTKQWVFKVAHAICLSRKWKPNDFDVKLNDMCCQWMQIAISEFKVRLHTVFTCYLLDHFHFFRLLLNTWFFFSIKWILRWNKRTQIIILIAFIGGGILFTGKRLCGTLIHDENEMHIQMRIRFGYSYKYGSLRIFCTSFIQIVGSSTVLVSKFKKKKHFTGFSGTLFLGWSAEWVEKEHIFFWGFSINFQKWFLFHSIIF